MDVDDWESKQESYVRTLVLLRHIQEAHPGKKIVLACGGDMALTMVTDAWSPEDVSEILRDFPLIIVPRPKTSGVLDDEKNITTSFSECSYTREYLDNISFANDVPICSVSSTLVRERVREGLSTLGLISSSVKVYIDKKGHYK